MAYVGIAAATWSLVTDVLNYITPCLKSRLEKRSSLKLLTENAGEWAKEAKDVNGRWQQPLLRNEALEAHLVQRKGILQNRGTCEASFGWAKLLFALNIRPGNEILEWQPSSSDNDPEVTGTISLAIEGHALCHIINLYQRYTSSSVDLTNEYRFPFGTLELKEESHQRIFAFAAGSFATLATYKPFEYSFQDEDGFRKGHLIPKTSPVMDCYLNTLNSGGSDVAISLKKGRETRQDRAQSLLRAFALLQTKAWDNPYFVTPTWIREASTIKRRLTTNGGKDNDLVDHICNFISENAEDVENIRRHLPRNFPWQESLRKTVKSFCMSQENTFEFVWDIDTLNQSEKDPIKPIVRQLIPMAAASHSRTEREEGSWVDDLFKEVTAGEMVEILNLPHQIVNRPVIVLKEELRGWEYLAEILG